MRGHAMSQRRSLFVALFGSASLIALSASALADQPPLPQDGGGTAAAAAEDKGEKVERVVVTAQKKSESIRDVPMGITAVTQETLQRQRATSFSDYVPLVPGMTSNEPEPTHT